MNKFLCWIFTRGKHSFHLRCFRYRCVWCGELRMRVQRQLKLDLVMKPKPGVIVIDGMEYPVNCDSTTVHPLEEEMPELAGELRND